MSAMSAMINAATGWNTWNYECLTALSFVDGSRVELELRVSVFDDIRVEHVSDIRWKDLVRLGPHAADARYLALEFEAGFEARFLLEAATEGDALALRVTPTRTSPKRVVLEFRAPGRALAPGREGDTWDLGGWQARIEGAEPPNTFYVRTTGPNAVGRRGDRITALIQRAGAAPIPNIGASIGATIDATIDAARHGYAATSLETGGGLAGAPEVAIRAANWNTVYDLTGRGVCTPASRDWCRDWRGVVLFGWDTYFNGLIAGLEDPGRAWANYAASLAGAAPDGFVPNWAISNGVYTVDRSQPPVGALCVWKTYLRDPDTARLRTLYPALLRWHRWWRDRRITPDGLLAWGSDPNANYAYPELRQAMYGAHICCCYESGMDNSPLFDSVPYDRESGLMRQSDVGLTSLFAADADYLARIAGALGEAGDAAEMRAEAQDLGERIESLFWCEEEGIYLNRGFDGRFNPRRSPTSFYPLLCGAPSPERAARLVCEHLLNPAEFWGDYPLPSIARNDPAFGDNDYWRGRIWAPMTYLVVEGLRRCGMDDVARDVTMRSLRMFQDNWERRGAVYENYNAVTGDGGDVHNADPLYAWGGLLAYAALEELATATDRGLQFGTGSGEALSVRRLLLRGHRYDVEQDASGLRVDRDGVPLTREPSPRRIVLMEDGVTEER